MKLKTVASYLMLTILLTFSFIVFAKDNAVYVSKKNNIAIKGYDTVAYFVEDKAVKGKKSLSYEWHNAKWLFSSEENKNLFKANPEKYAPQYGGWCAYAMSDGRTVKIDPKAFEIYNDKLYLNYSKSVQKHWVKDKDLFIMQADAYYPNVVDLSALN